MNRLGISHLEAFRFIKELSSNSNFIIDGIYTHFATADERDKRFTLKQLKHFKILLKELKKNKINYGVAHTANSAAVLDLPETYFDMVRPGIALYGYYPSLETSESIHLKPVMSIISYVTSVKEIKPGDTVSYGRKFITETRTKIASVPIGYADGFSRNLTNKSKAIIKGKFYQQVGTVTMDRTMFDIHSDNIKPGDRVILLGSFKDLSISAWDWAKVLNTIPYEVTCGITKRLPRIYI
jgi:alanine racemase